MPFGPLLVFILACLGLTFTPSAAAAADSTAEGDTRPVVRIGFIAPVTGPLAYIGEDVLRWSNLAIQDIFSSSDVYRYEIVFEDDQTQPRQSVLAARRLASQGANILLTYGSAPGVAVAPIANSQKIPHLAIAYNKAAVVGDYNLTMVNPIEDCVPDFLKFLDKKGYHKIALMGVRNATWQSVFDTLDRLNEDGQIDLAYKRIYQPGERDFRLGLQQIPEDIDVLLIVSWPPELNIIARQFREQGVDIPITSIAGSFIFSKDRELFEGCIDSYFFDLIKADELNRKMTGQPVYSGGGPMAYDEIFFIHQIFESFPEMMPSSEQVMDRIRKLGQLDGPMLGTGILGDDKAFHYRSNYYRIQDGNITIVPFEEL